MTTSSRTPEGWSNRCPVCENVVHVESSRIFGDATCPVCGTLIWFFSASEGTIFLIGEEADEIRRLMGNMARGDEAATEKLREKLQAFFDQHSDRLGLDSMRIVELVMELEEDIDT